MHNPIRRSRKIGKTQGGRVKDGQPQEKWSHLFPEDIYWQLSENSEKWRVLRENPSREYYHPCSCDDYLGVLKQLPGDLTEHVSAIVLRRLPKEDERFGIDARRRYSCVIMNAFPKSNETPWLKRPTKGVVKHLAPWCDRWRSDSGQWRLVWKPEEVRRYYLYHVFLHEVGHINQPWSYSSRQREAFAENFALEWARKLGAL
ncbi:MAG: hypothetical protein AAGJ10_00510 [Bacteroidota bacterium]